MNTKILKMNINIPQRPTICGGNELRQAIKTKRISIEHRFKWSDDEAVLLASILNPKYKAGAVADYIELMEKPILLYALSKSEYPLASRPWTVTQDLKDLQKISQLLADASKITRRLGDVGKSQLVSDLEIPPGSTSDFFTQMSESVSRGIVDTRNWFRDYENQMDTDIRQDSEIFHRGQMVETLAKFYSVLSPKPAPSTYLGPFDKVLSVAFKAVGLKSVKYKQALIKKSRGFTLER